MSAPISARVRALRAFARISRISRHVESRHLRAGPLLRVLRILGTALVVGLVPTQGAAMVAESGGGERTPRAALMPDVWIYPYDGSTVSSSPITVYVDACDYYSGSVSYIDLYVNGSYYGTEWNWYSGCLSMSRTVYLSSG